MTAELGREEWLAWRREGVGASDVAGILGLSPWASPWSVWADKLGLLPETPENEYMTAGRWLERAIGPWFEHETGLHVEGEQTPCESPDNELHRCTVDGFVSESDPCTHGGDCELPGHPDMIHEGIPIRDPAHALAWLGTLQIKVTGPGRRWEEIPTHYQAQCQWELHVTGLERSWLAVLMGRRLDIHELARDQADIDLMIERVDAFWHDFVQTRKPPPADGHDATLDAIAAVYPKHVEGQAVEADAAALRELRALTASKASKAEATALEKLAKARLAAALGTAEELTVKGERVLTFRQQKGRTTTCKACGHEETGEPFRVMRPVKAKGAT